MIKDYTSFCFSKTLTTIFVAFFFILNLAVLPEATAAEYSVYGPRVYLRDTGKPFIETDTLTAPVYGNDYLLKISNGGWAEEYKHVSSAIITLNGGELLLPNELNQQVDYIEKKVSLQQLNKLSVEVRGKPGGALVINVIGIDNDLPVITANVSPQVNIAGWHNTDATVTFDCTDAISGIASCTPPVIVTTEGAGQVVTGTAVDIAGNTASTSAQINLDKTPPVINLTSPAADSLLSQPDVIISGQTYDTLSFVTATINGIDLGLLMDGSFSYPVALSEGINTYTIVAIDRADNSSTQQFTVTYQPINNPPVALPINVITQQNNPVEITLTASDEDGDGLNYMIVKQPAHGQLSGSGVTLTYQPDIDYYGLDSFDFVANDGSDNSNVATVNIDVTNQLVPFLMAPPADIVAEATGPLTPLGIGVAIATDVNGVSVATVPDNIGPYPLGVTLVTWTAINSQGDMVSSQQKITVQDTTPPVVTLIGPDYLIVPFNEAHGSYEFGATAYDLVDGNVTESIVTSDFFGPPGPGDFAFLFTVRAQYTATDSSGNSVSTIRVSNFTFDVIAFISAPELVNYVYSNIIEAVGELTPIEQPIVRDYLGNEVVILAFTTYESSDRPISRITRPPITIPDQLAIGSYRYVAHSVDAYGVYGYNFFSITVTDTTPPDLTLTGLPIIEIDVDTIPYEEAGATAYDIVAGDLSSKIQISGTVDTSTPGSYTIVYTVTDDYANTSQVIRTVNVVTSLDITPPVITAPDDMAVEATAILTPVNIGSASVNDDFDGALFAIPDSIGPFPIGQNSIVWSAVDAAGNVGVATQIVSIVDTTPPVLSIPADITVAFGNTQPIVIGAAQATDIFPVSISNNAPNTYPAGSTTVLWQAVDANGNITTAIQVITVNASLAPVAIVGTDKTVSINTPINFDASNSFDPDGQIVSYIWKNGAVVLSTDVAFIKSNLAPGAHVISLTVTDNTGTVGSASIVITIVEESVQAMTQCKLKPIIDDKGFSDIYPDANIDYLGENYNDVAAIEKAFNSARYQDKSVSRYLKMPLQSVWDAMSAQQKGLYLVNSERLARDVKPFEGTSQNIVSVAQVYAEYMRVNNQVIGHYNDGRSPQERMDADPVILNNRDVEIKSENVFATFATSLVGVGTADERIVQAVYAFIYEDNYPLLGEAWGHRSSLLQLGLIENSGSEGEEGLIGFGVAQGEYNPESSPYYPYGSIIVMNLIDATGIAEYTGVETVDAPSTLQCNDALNIELDQSTIQLPTLERIYIPESQLVLVVGQTQYINVVGVLSDGSEQDVTSLVDFAPDNFSVVSINAGQVTGLVVGNVGVTVSANGISSNRLMIRVGSKTDTSNLTGTDAEQYIPYIPDNASVTRYNENSLTLLTGQVNDLYNFGIEGVSVSILNGLDYGTTFTDNNGKFVFAVPAGNHVVSLSKAGYLSVQKNSSAPSHSWGIVETAILQTIDDKSTVIDLSSNIPQVHQSTPYTDLRGTRSTTLVFDGINTATVTSADGTQRALASLSVSATEFTTPETMPGVLPDTSAYTYCADLTVAGVADNESVSFDNDVIMYVDNFLNFDIGEIVPIGYYDRLLGEWVGSKNGVVVELLDSDNDGLVDGVDYTGDGIADDVDGDNSTTDETRGIENYPVGGIYWRGAFNHFTPVDFNWSTSFGNNATQAKKFPIGTNENGEKDKECNATNSYVDIKSSAFHEDIAIAGTNLTLHYNSQRTEGYKHTINVRVSGDLIPATLQEMIVKVEIAGVTLEQTFLPQTNQEANFVWDGYNAVGKIERGEIKGVIKVGYAYPVNYNSNGNAATTSLSLDQFVQAWAKTGPNVTTVEGRQEGTIWTTQTLTLYNAPESEIASGWSLSNQHVLTPSDKIYLGSGSVQDIVSASNVFKTGVVDSFITGDDGFYQKSGKAIDFDILTGDILHDNVTDLMWQYKDPRYFSSNQAAVNYCESLDLGSFTDWRIATLKEDTYTRNKGNLNNEIAIYSGSAPERWNSLTFNFPNGPLNNFPVYCARGEILDEKYVQDLERNIVAEVVIDKSNGLMWQDDSSVLTTQGDWAFAINHCEALDNAGYNDWRLPNINEFMYVLPNDTFSNRFNFPPEPWTRTHPDARPFWSSTPNVLNVSNAWAIESEGYNSANYPQTDNNNVRCVRDDLSLARSPYLFDAGGKHIKTIDQDTGTTQLTYNYDASSGKLNNIVDLFGNQISLIRQNGVLTAIESPDGLLTNLVIYNNDLLEVNYQDGSGYQFGYQSSLMTSEIDPNGNLYPHYFDTNGRVDQTLDQEGGVWDYFNQRATGGDKLYGYTTAENNRYQSLLSTLDNGDINKVTTLFDGTQLIDLNQADDLKQTLQSCAVTTVIDKVIDIKTKKPIPSKITVTQPSGLKNVTQLSKTYGQDGADTTQQTLTVNLNGKISSVFTNALTGVTTATSAENRTTTLNVDPVTSLLQSSQTPGLLDTTYTYDNRGRQKSITTGARSTTYTYDPVSKGEVTFITAVDGKVTEFEYDTLGRVKAIIYPDTRRTENIYDNNGNLKTLVIPTPANHDFTYNSVNKLKTESTPKDNVITEVTQYDYDLERNLKQITLPSGKTITNTYVNGLLDFSTTPEGIIYYDYTCNEKVSSITEGSERINYTYDGNLLKDISYAGGLNETISQTYNTDFNINTLTYAGQITNFGYDDDLLLTSTNGYTITRNSQNGLPEILANGTLLQNRVFNGYGEAETVTTKVNAQNVYDYALTYNDLGKITTKTETLNDGTINTYVYVYDDRRRLDTVTKNGSLIEDYGYDGNGNRNLQTNTARGITAQSATYNLGDQLKTVGATTYDYDADGYLSKKTAIAGITTYAYSSQGRLLQVVTPSKTISYQHNALGNRVAKLVNGVITEKYLWLGKTTLLATYDATDTLLQRYQYTDGNTPDSFTQGGQTYYIVTDHLGSPRAITDATGAIVKKLDYDSFGNVLSDSNPSLSIPFGFAGGLFDVDTGLVRFGFRDYDADTGRWTARDPIGFAGGDTNLYGYTFNDPINFIDPSGLAGIMGRPNPFGANIPTRGNVTFQRSNEGLDRAFSNLPDGPTLLYWGQRLPEFSPEVISAIKYKQYLKRLKAKRKLDNLNGFSNGNNECKAPPGNKSFSSIQGL